MQKISRFLTIGFIILLSLVSTACSTNTVQNKTEPKSTEEKVLRMDEENLGYPSVYTVSSRGRGYLMMSFIFDTLTWKDEKGVITLLAEKWEVTSDQKTWTFNLKKMLNLQMASRLLPKMSSFPLTT